MMRKLHIAALALAVAGSAGSSMGQTSITADVTTNTTWGGAAVPCPVILQSVIFVKNATLTILPGCLVRGQPRSGPVIAGNPVGSPGALVVTQTGRLNAVASAANPIIMTTAAVDNNGDGIADDVDAPIGFEDEWVPGDLFLDANPSTSPLSPLNPAGTGNVALWGGLVLLGNAPTNLADKCGVGYGKCTIEGLTIPGFPVADATYGGIEPHDNSGTLRYISIRHAGDEIGNSNELNGLSMGGVGDGTTIDHVEVYANFDDGFEWFGGTVNSSFLAVFFVGDDMFDLDEGYAGINQFLFGVMPFFNENGGTPYGSASGDKAGEWDGDNYRPDNVLHNDNVNVRARVDLAVSDPTCTPFPQPAFYNMTVIGTTPDAGQFFTPVSVAGTNRGIQWRNGGGGTLANSIITNTGAETGIEIDLGLTGCPGFNSIDNANNGYTQLVCSTLDDGAAPAAQETTVINNGNALNLALGGTAAGANTINSAGFNGLIVEDQTFNPQGAAGHLTPALKPAKLNPRPAAGFVGVGGCVAPNGPGLDRSATYRGAFSASAPTLWTTGWTAMNVGGLLAN